MSDSAVKRSSASLIWASLAILFFVFAMLLMVQIRNLSQSRDVDLDVRAEAIAIMTSPNARMIATSNALVVLSRSRRVVLLASDLPRLPQGKTFELWFMPQTSKGIAFGATRSHTAEIVATPPAASTSLAVTIEDESGASSPAGQPVFTIGIDGHATSVASTVPASR